MNSSPDRNYLPIADHGVIGDLRSVALVGTDGTIDWYCPGRFDAPSVFGGILDSAKGGHYRISAVHECTTKQLYVPDTNVLITRFLTPMGVGEVEDFMPIGEVDEPQRLVRRVVCVRGELRFRVEVEPRFDYGRAPHKLELNEHGAVFESEAGAVTLHAPVPLERHGDDVRATIAMRAGEVEGGVGERQRSAVALDELRVRQGACPRELEQLGHGIEADDLPHKRREGERQRTGRPSVP